jgi:hypothetical protein
MEDLTEKIERIEQQDQESSEVILSIAQQIALLESKLERQTALMAVISSH